MSFAINTQYGPLIFGSYTSDARFPGEGYEIPADYISELGTDLTEFCAVGQTLTMQSNESGYYLTLDNVQQPKAPDTSYIVFAAHGPSMNTIVMTFAGSEPKSYILLNAYAMANPSIISEDTRISIVAKYQNRDSGAIVYRYYDATYNSVFYEVLSRFNDYTPYEPPKAEGAFGLADKTSEPVDFPALPLVSALGTGTVNMYRATQASLREFSQFLWTGDFIDNVKKLFQDPMEALISVQIVPYSPPQADTLSNVYMSWIDTGVKMYPLTNQFLEVDCGTLTVSEFWGSFLDYPPNTEISIFLPYIGLKSLSVQDVMDRTIELRYHIDCLTGTCLAMLKCSGNGLNSVLYSWSGSCNTQIPIAARDFSSIYSSIIGLVSTAGIAAATGGSGVAAKAAVGAAAGVSALKSATLDTHVRQSGSVGSTPSYLGIQKPFLIISRPLDSTPTDFNEQTGRPSNLTGKVGDFSGYLESSYCHLENLVATDAEKREIESLLKSGIFL